MESFDENMKFYLSFRDVGYRITEIIIIIKSLNLISLRVFVKNRHYTLILFQNLMLI